MSKKHKTPSEEQSQAGLEETLQQVNRRERSKHPDPKYWQNPSNVFDRVGVVLQSRKAFREEQDSALQAFMKEYLEPYHAELPLILPYGSKKFLYAIVRNDEAAKQRLRNEIKPDRGKVHNHPEKDRGTFKKTITAPIDPRRDFGKDWAEQHVAEQNITRTTFECFFRTKEAHSTDDYLYIVRDNATVLYIGQSLNLRGRLSQHLGSKDRFGKLFRLNMRSALSWIVEMPTLAQCKFVVEALYIPGEDKERTNAEIIKQYLNPQMRPWAVNTAEEVLIWLYQPCCNRDGNPFPTPLPSEYFMGNRS